jgi:hypothetical protein
VKNYSPLPLDNHAFPLRPLSDTIPLLQASLVLYIILGLPRALAFRPAVT